MRMFVVDILPVIYRFILSIRPNPSNAHQIVQHDKEVSNVPEYSNPLETDIFKNTCTCDFGEFTYILYHRHHILQHNRYWGNYKIFPMPMMLFWRV